jgi:hypothetical protein
MWTFRRSHGNASDKQTGNKNGGEWQTAKSRCQAVAVVQAGALDACNGPKAVIASHEARSLAVATQGVLASGRRASAALVSRSLKRLPWPSGSDPEPALARRQSRQLPTQARDPDSR